MNHNNLTHRLSAWVVTSILLAASVFTLADDTTSTVSEVATKNQPKHDDEKKVVGYFTEWGIYDRNYHVKNVRDSGSAEHLTHIIYAFGNVENGQCQLGDAHADINRFYGAEESVDGIADSNDEGALRGNFGQLKRLKTKYPHLKILWSFGGQSWSGGFSEAAQNPEEFAESCYQLVNDPRWAGLFDGIDIDWEYPSECGVTCDTSGFEVYPELMKSLRERFGSQMVTAAISANEAKLKVADYSTAAQYVDFYMLMSYDFFGAWDKNGPTAPHSPLYGYSGIPVGILNTDYAVQLLKDLGIPSQKILLGLGFYGRGWTGVEDALPGSLATGPAEGKYEAGVNDYKVLKEICPATGRIAGTSYAYCDGDWWSYDTPVNILGKMHYVRDQGLGGTFFWELSGDTEDGELIRAISNGLGKHHYHSYKTY